MIKNKDRRFWIGGSDTSYVVGNWKTQSFENWWREKLGLKVGGFGNKYTLAGTYYETAILNTVSGIKKNGVYEIPELSLRVNLDGEVGDVIYECKTHKSENEFKVSKQYYRQAQAQMLATGFRKVVFIAYPLTEEHYDNYFIPIDKAKIHKETVLRDDRFINEELIPKLKYLSECIKKGHFPTDEEYIKQKSKGMLNITKD